MTVLPRPIPSRTARPAGGQALGTNDRATATDSRAAVAPRATGARRAAVALRGVLALFAVVAGAVLLGAPATHAESGYRYWSFWEQKPQDDSITWSYATQGPAVLRPVDGDVLGFRFAVGRDAGDKAATPRGETDFATVCGSTDEKRGSKRVALRIDPGTAEDAPRGESPPKPRSVCALVDEDASAAEALAATAEPLRYNSDTLLCAIDGYPEKGCGEQVADSDGTDDARDGGTADTADGNGGNGGDGGLSPGVGVGIGAAAVLALGAAGLWQARRRR